MTSSNINKIVRSNINLKPWVLSKNTSEIVNTCIQKIYKQSQTNFKNDIIQPKTAAPRTENKGPIRSLKSQERIRPPISFVSRPKREVRAGTNASGGGAVAAGGGPRFASAAMQGKKSAVANLAANKRLLRSSPNYKIYSSRRFGSSASSSNASIFRRSEDRRRINQTMQLNYLLRSFATTHKAPTSPNYGVNVGVAHYALQARNQHMQSSAATAPHVAQMSTSLQRDLMAIDHTIKERIALGRKGLKLNHRRNKDVDPLNGWNHPPPPELFMPRFKEANDTNLELEQQYQRLKTVNRMRQFEQLHQMEKRTSILGAVGKKAGRGQPLDAFGTVKEESPRTTPHLSARRSVLDRARRSAMRKQAQAAEVQPAEDPPIRLSPPASPVPYTMPSMTEPPKPPKTSATTNASINANISAISTITGAAQVASTEPATSTVADMVAASPASSSFLPALPAPTMAAAYARAPSAPMPTATSMIAAATNRTTAYNNSRFNRSSYSYKKF